MKFDTIIRSGTVHTSSASFPADVGISGTTIAAVGNLAKAKAKREVDASGMLVVPGFLDVHVHLALPFCGTVSCDDYESGSRAAACGGITCVIDFAIPGEGQSMHDAHEVWLAKAEGRSIVDYSWHMALTRREHVKEIGPLVRAGLPTFKEFMIYEREGWNADDAMMFATMEEIRRQERSGGAMLLVHAESARVLDELIDRHHTPAMMKKHGAKLHPMTRPNFIEAEAIERAIHLCGVTGAPLYIVHMSTAEGAELVKSARARGVRVAAETCVQYLTLDDSVFGGKDGHLFACCPQVKKKADIARLWAGADDRGGGEVCVVSTDTCSFTREQKKMWWNNAEGYGDWTKIPMGLPGLDTLVPLMYTEGVLTGRITMNRLVELCSTNPARIMGLGHRKGQLAPGFDADVVVMDPSRSVTIDHRGLQSRCDWNPWQGREASGFAHTTFVRGTPVVEGYKVVGKPGHGRFLERHEPGGC
jgi:dihydropyrimidinase